MKERPMRWASGILLILLLILGIASPALAADSPHNPLMACLFFFGSRLVSWHHLSSQRQTPSSAPGACPGKVEAGFVEAAAQS
jgi:hypothetical protein